MQRQNEDAQRDAANKEELQKLWQQFARKDRRAVQAGKPHDVTKTVVPAIIEAVEQDVIANSNAIRRVKIVKGGGR